MKFLNLGLFTLSSLFAASCAAPTAQTSLVPVPNVNTKEPVTNLDTLNTRTDSVVCSKVKTCIVEVKKHTSKINSTCAAYTKTVSQEDKISIIKVVKSEITVVVQLISTLVGEVVGLLGETVEKIEQEELVQLVLELIFEIVFTLKKVLSILKISIFELLGPLVFVLLSVIVHLLTVLNVLVDGLLKLVFTLLGDVVVLLAGVLSGLLPIVLGLVGGILGKVESLVSCLL